MEEEGQGLGERWRWDAGGHEGGGGGGRHGREREIARGGGTGMCEEGQRWGRETGELGKSESGKKGK